MAASTILIGTISPRRKGHYTTLGKMPTFLARRLKEGGVARGRSSLRIAAERRIHAAADPNQLTFCRINPEPCSPFWGAHAPSRVPAGAFAGRSGGHLRHQMVVPMNARLCSARARNTAREGACAPPFNCLVPAERVRRAARLNRRGGNPAQRGCAGKF